MATAPKKNEVPEAEAAPATPAAPADIVSAEVVNTEANQPYPTGNPPDNRLVIERTHRIQDRVAAEDRYAQSEANLKAGGKISGGAAHVAKKTAPKAKSKAKSKPKAKAPEPEE